ncbi:MAG: IS30 family transposase, partial [Actinobacteria bacterium]|nr:IS30 family transposase [Actinomycetota bacterium]
MGEWFPLCREVTCFQFTHFDPSLLARWGRIPLNDATPEVLEVVVGRAGRRSRGPGAVPLQAQRQEYAGLRARGVSNAEACRIVGVNRRTGTRWLHGRSVPVLTGGEVHYPPVINYQQSVRSERFLSEDELIAERLRVGESLRAISRELGRAASTISREVARNGDEAGGYRPAAAQRLATARLHRPRARRLGTDLVLRAAVQGMLDQAWSPEQIGHALRERFPDVAVRQLCHESIYQAIYDRDSVLSRHRCGSLRTGRRRRRPRPRGDARTPRSLRDMTSIHQRPAGIADRAEAGHWEGDLITGALNRSAIGTLVERTTRYTVLVHLPDSHTASGARGPRGFRTGTTMIPVWKL